jgi:hypothetical protein
LLSITLLWLVVVAVLAMSAVAAAAVDFAQL